jgi:hypothetical protein
MKSYRGLRATALLAALLAVPLTQNTFAAAVVGIDPKTTVTASMDGGTAKTGNTWYEVGVNTSSNLTGLATGLISGQSDPLSTYLIQSASGNNALMLDSANKTGTLKFDRALPLTAISLSGASGNGSGTNILTLNFSDGTKSTLGPLVAGDWFNNTNRVETSHGRIDLGANTFNNAGADNPRVLALDETIPTADQSKLVTSIDISWSGGATTHTAIFGVSGDITGIGHYTAIPLDATSFNQDLIVGLQEVPEPGTLALLGLGVAGMLVACRRKLS